MKETRNAVTIRLSGSQYLKLQILAKAMRTTDKQAAIASILGAYHAYEIAVAKGKEAQEAEEAAKND